MPTIRPLQQNFNSKVTQEKNGRNIVKAIGIGVLVFTIMGSVAYSIPEILAIRIQNKQEQATPKPLEQFPVTVDPVRKIIVENDEVNSFLEGPTSPLQASAGGLSTTLQKITTWIASVITETPWYQNLSAVDGHFITLSAGMRKEQVIAAFSKKLKWSKADALAFTTPTDTTTVPVLPLSDGSFLSGVYFVGSASTPEEVQQIVNKRFQDEVLSRYDESVSSIVPLEQALIIASLIERETMDHADKRLISGIIWNRIFAGMKLQIDATLQYAKATNSSSGSWWPTVVPADKYRKSAYNTYIHKGLPPSPIASPSVAAIVAALNPIETPCLYYFNDKSGEFHCSKTYEEHVSQLKRFYGKGK